MKATDVKVAPFVRNALKEYGTYVVEGRAIPDIRDGLKPVQRRILYAMHSLLGLKFSKPPRKSSKVVGQVMGDLHPHGDQSIYDTMVNMVHHRYPTVEGQGNFGSSVDPAAAARYTECRLTQLGEDLFDCISAAKMVENYSGDLLEPAVIPSRIPLLLVNGSRGIAYGISTNIPPHNLSEICRLCIKVLKSGESADLKKVVGKTLLGPDFPHGILTSSDEDVLQLYQRGRGVLTFRCTYDFVKAKDHWILEVSNFAPDFSPSRFINKCQELVDSGQLSYVADVGDAEEKILVGFTNPRIIEQRVLPLMNTSVGFAFYFLEPDSEGVSQPVLANLSEIIERWLAFRSEVESEIIRQKITELEKQHLREDAKLAAIRKLDSFAAIVMDRELDTAQKMLQIQRVLQINEEQAEYAYHLSFSQLDARNEPAVLEKMSTLEDDIIDQKYLLDNVRDVVESKLRDYIKSHGKGKRNMQVRSDLPEIPTVSQKKLAKTVLVGTNGNLERKNPNTRGKTTWWEFTSRVNDSLTMITSSGIAYAMDMAYTKDGATKAKNVVGVASDRAELMVARDSQGYVGVVNYQQSKSDFAIFKNDGDIIQAYGVEPNDVLLCVAGDKTAVIEYSDLKPKRRNAKGIRLMPRRSDYSLVHIPHDAMIVNSRGKTIPRAKWDTIHRYRGYKIIHPKNYVQMTDGSKSVLDVAETRRLLSNEEEVLSVRRIE